MARKTEPNIATVDELGQSFDNSQKYPFTLPISLPRALPQHYYELLSQHSSTLCHESRSYISLWRLRDGEQSMSKPPLQRCFLSGLMDETFLPWDSIPPRDQGRYADQVIRTSEP